jgi:hypothetical protein
MDPVDPATTWATGTRRPGRRAGGGS